MRILLSHVYSWPEVRRGGERYLHELGAALVEAGHRVRIVSTAPTASRDKVLGVPVRRLPRRNRLGRYGELAPEVCFGLETVARYAARRVDVWHAFGTADAAASAFLSKHRRWPKVRSVYTDLGGPLREWREARTDNNLFEYVVQNIDAFLCLSETTRAMLDEDYQRPGLVVGGGVDLDRFRPAPARSPHPTLLFTGALNEPRKNLPLLLDALDVLLDTQPDVRLWLSAPGDPTDALNNATPRARAAVDDLGVGTAGHVERLYSEAWTTVLPSLSEAFGLVLVESLACGTPIVALADGGGPAEIVEPGVGALASAVTPEALAAACAAALDLARQGQPTTDACRAAAQRYGWREAIVPRLEKIYRGELTEAR
jgi:phosphatidylinositol alpha-mannosyltransferase